MSAVAMQSLYAEAQQLFQEGRLQQCREAVEDLLLALSRDASNAETTTTTSSTPVPHRQRGLDCASEAATRHKLFASGLLLLSSCYSAVSSLHEAERLLATCQGYVEEHGASFETTPAACERSVNLAMASLAYSRAAIRLELYRTQADTPVDVVEEASTVFLAEAERRLVDVLGPERLLLADVWHSRGVSCEILATADGQAKRSKSGGRKTPSPTAGSMSPHFPLTLRALEYYTRSMDIRARYTDAGGVTELKLALTMEHIAHLLRLSATPAEPGRREEALSLLDTVSSTRRRLLGPRHPLVASTLLARGALCVELGRYRSARKDLTTAQSIVTEVYPADDVRVAEVAYWLTRVS